MSVRNPQLPNVCSRRGAPMGRDTWCEPQRLTLCRCFKLKFIDGGYDEGGAYWGAPADVYCCKSAGSADSVQLFTRACDRQQAKVNFKAAYPGVKWVN